MASALSTSKINFLGGDMCKSKAFELECIFLFVSTREQAPFELVGQQFYTLAKRTVCVELLLRHS